MPEIILNLHMHTRYSDGSGLHADIAHAALNAGLDAVIVTDHNVLISGPAGYPKIFLTEVGKINNSNPF
jgi:predicted metal-dependent phosphoesterase TrpH